MPELPETETIARDLDGALRGAVIRSVEILREDVLRDPVSGGRALTGSAARSFSADVRRRLTDVQVVRVHRRAKSIVVSLATADALVVTPRFTGALLLGAAEPSVPDRAASADAESYDCLRFALADGRRLTYRDIRRLGTVALCTAPQLATWDAALGPEPLDPALTPERFSGIVRGSNRPVKSILMDQRRLAGVGNIYANEACFRAGLRPARRGAAVSRARASSLLAALRVVLTESIALRGTTFRDFQDAYGGRGGFAARLQVYGRGGKPCLACGTPLRETHALEGRSTVWCPACQR